MTVIATLISRMGKLNRMGFGFSLLIGIPGHTPGQPARKKMLLEIVRSEFRLRRVRRPFFLRLLSKQTSQQFTTWVFRDHIDEYHTTRQMLVRHLMVRNKLFLKKMTLALLTRRIARK